MNPAPDNSANATRIRSAYSSRPPSQFGSAFTRIASGVYSARQTEASSALYSAGLLARPDVAVEYFNVDGRLAEGRGVMTGSEAWTVRHLYSAAERHPDFLLYVQRIRQMLDEEHSAGRIWERHDIGLSDDSEILPALEDIGFGELVIVDLHGWADHDDPARLGTLAEGPYATLADLPARFCRPAAIVLGNCRGARGQFYEAIARIICDPVAVVGHFDKAAYRDHAPIGFAYEILTTAHAADPYAAQTAMDIAIHNNRANPWDHAVIQPR